MVRLIFLTVALALVLSGCYGPYGNSEIGFRDRPLVPYSMSNNPYERECQQEPSSKGEMMCEHMNRATIAHWGRCHQVIPFEPFPENDPEFKSCGLTKADLPPKSEYVPTTAEEAIQDLNEAQSELDAERMLNEAISDAEREEHINSVLGIQ